jgi:hypothetical protein
MTSQLNPYCSYIDIWTKEGQALAWNATDKFISPLLGNNHISLAGTSFQRLKDNILWLGAHYGYGYLFKSCITTWVFIPEVIADPANNVIGQPEQLYYENPINMLEHYLDENVALAHKHASLTWGDLSLTLMPKNTIRDLSQANGTLNNAGNSTAEGKKLILEQMHFKFLGYQILELLTDLSHQANQQQSSLYTWVTADRKEEEVVGLTILALILACICPNFKVDMYTKITKVKKITIAQYGNDVQFYFDAVQFLKLQIDQKDPTAYTTMHSLGIFFFKSIKSPFLLSFVLNLAVKKLIG